ncbi:hypothetical protein M378DRAFT_12891 [Amanita muscaria Koide BX008]|uniref:Uncharacterized protein n=1 Tax=Amanita muscaria (strain Koide BX008) TaxID=946122 RepID=A0A0C2WL54_AMAMK|nr:hypothetical protein M378DRAFT_12891 [Amanita muscaria Koide BX008]
MMATASKGEQLKTLVPPSERSANPRRGVLLTFDALENVPNGFKVDLSKVA